MVETRQGGCHDLDISVFRVDGVGGIKELPYLGAVPVFNNRDLAKAAASILGDEAMHWAVLRNAVGEAPHCGLFGRRAGSVKDFAYSDAMKRSKIVWNERTLDDFLANPLTVVPGTAMGYAGVADRSERTNLIAYLKEANQSPECRK